MEIKKTTAAMIHEVLNDPCASRFLKTALKENLQRDPVDAAADMEWLYRLFAQRCAEIFQQEGIAV